MDREVINQFFLIIKGIVIVGIIVWNIARIVQTRHCWKRKEPCENSQCKWWNFCDKHGETLTVDIYRLKKLKEIIEREQKERNK